MLSDPLVNRAYSYSYFADVRSTVMSAEHRDVSCIRVQRKVGHLHYYAALLGLVVDPHEH